MIRFNVNDFVRVKLTDVGRKAHRAWHDRLFAHLPKEKRDEWYRAPEEDEDGWSRWQMWNLMQEVGWACSLSDKPPFETDIILEVKGVHFARPPITGEQG